MTAKYRVIGRREDRPKRALGEYNVPDAAMQLNEEIQAIRWALELLQRVDERNITHGDADFGYLLKHTTLTQIKTWERTARKKLTDGYLAK
jgi:hypothetical protein